jgi:hypothetical protein
MTNQEVVDLVKAGFTDDLIVARIHRAEQKAFDLAPAALVRLKEAGVSERVMLAMMGTERPSTAPTTPPLQTTGSNRKDPAARVLVSAVPAPSASADGREAGIYLAEGTEGNLIPLEPTVFSGGKTGGIFASSISMGFKKAKWKAVVRSARAVQRVTSKSPVFFFYFEDTGSGLRGGPGNLGASSANEFVLARMSPTSHDRELVVGEWGLLGMSNGTRSEDTIEMSIERVRPGVYRVSPRTQLEAGEYCFFYAGGVSAFAAAGTGKLFDFGVD